MKKFVSLILSLAICLALVPSAFAAETRDTPAKFTDVPADAWYWDELDYALANGYISGTSDTTFSPSANVTRGQFVTILGRMLGVDKSGSGVTQFKDVDPNSYYAPYVKWAADLGYVNGYSSVEFGPNNPITVEQMGCILANYVHRAAIVLQERDGYDKIPFPSTFSSVEELMDSFYKEAIYTEYADSNSISTYAKISMGTMWKYDLIPVDAFGNINPQKYATRVDATVSLVRLARNAGFADVQTVKDQLLTGKVTYASLIPGNPQLISSHAADDFDAIDNNIRYMLKNGLTEIKLHKGANISNYLSVLQYYPEFGYNSVYGGNGVIRLSCSFCSGEEFIKYKNAALEAAVRVHDDLVLAGYLKSGMTQYDKAGLYFEVLSSHCGYGSPDDGVSHIAYGALVDGIAVCQGYTAAYNMLLKLEGIACSTATNPVHMWTTATLDGKFCHIDTTNGLFDAPEEDIGGRQLEDGSWEIPW